MRVSFVGGRTGDRFHADQEQVEDIERAVEAIPGARVEILDPAWPPAASAAVPATSTVTITIAARPRIAATVRQRTSSRQRGP